MTLTTLSNTVLKQALDGFSVEVTRESDCRVVNIVFGFYKCLISKNGDEGERGVTRLIHQWGLELYDGFLAVPISEIQSLVGLIKERIEGIKYIKDLATAAVRLPYDKLFRRMATTQVKYHLQNFILKKNLKVSPIALVKYQDCLYQSSRPHRDHAEINCLKIAYSQLLTELQTRPESCLRDNKRKRETDKSVGNVGGFPTIKEETPTNLET